MDRRRRRHGLADGEPRWAPRRRRTVRCGRARRPVEIPDAGNAFVAYAAAHKLVDPTNSIDEARRELFSEALWDGDIKRLTWSSALPGLREYLEAKRAALEVWRDGSRRRDAVYHQPGELSFGSGMHLIQDARVFAAMAALEGSRLEDTGARDEAWDWYLAILRCSRLIGRHGTLVQREYGARIHSLAACCILRWAADPCLEAGQLRQSLRDTLDADALTQPVSEAIKVDYLSCLSTLEDMTNFESTMRDFGRVLPVLGGRQASVLDQLVQWPTVRYPVQRFRLRASNDVERSRRAIRLLFANWLAQADRPASGRARLAIRKPTWIYADDPSAPAAARAVIPELLAKALDRTEIAGFLFGLDPDPGDPPWEGQGGCAGASPSLGVDRPAGCRALPRRAWRGPGNGRHAARNGPQRATRRDRGGRSDPGRSGLRVGSGIRFDGYRGTGWKCGAHG